MTGEFVMSETTAKLSGKNKEMKMNTKTGGLICRTWMLLMLGVATLGVPTTLPAADSASPVLKPGQHTVERHPQGAQTGTVARRGPCVIDLSAPNESGNCRLGVTDPPAKLIVTGWFRAGIDPADTAHSVNSAISGKKFKNVDEEAESFLKKARLAPIKFWDATPVKAPATLNAAPGATNRWTTGRENIEGGLQLASTIYSAGELVAAKQAALKWARAWKNYRGSRFGK